jgi:hypothetical protein
MNAPRRLLQDGTDFERQLLASARLDIASPRSCKRALAAVGTLAALGSTSVAGAASGSATGIAGSGFAVLVKWVGLGMAVGASATGAARLLEPPRNGQTDARIVSDTSTSMIMSRRESSETVSAAEAASSIAPFHATAASETRDDAGPTRVQLLPRNVEGPSPLKVAPHADTTTPEPLPGGPPIVPPAARPSPTNLIAEIAALAEVRAALGEGNATAAAFRLEAYRRTFPNAAFEDEATVLEINALFLQGDRAAAALLAHRYLAAHPSSPHAPRLRALAGESDNP